jgi:hypothetical protein
MQGVLGGGDAPVFANFIFFTELGILSDGESAILTTTALNKQLREC